MDTPVRCHIDARFTQYQHRGFRVMLERQATLRGPYERKTSITVSNRLLLHSKVPTCFSFAIPRADLSLTFGLEHHSCWFSSPHYDHSLNPDRCLKVAFGICWTRGNKRKCQLEKLSGRQLKAKSKDEKSRVNLSTPEAQAHVEGTPLPRNKCVSRE